jgi:hypothetical protein
VLLFCGNLILARGIYAASSFKAKATLKRAEARAPAKSGRGYLPNKLE